MSELRPLFAYLRPYWKQVGLAIIGLIFSSLITLALPYAMRILVDSVFLNMDLRELNLICLGLLLLFTVQAVVSYFYRFQLGWIAQRIVTDLRSDMHNAVLYLPLGFFANRRTGELLSRFSSDASKLQNIVVDAPTALIRQLITFLGGIGLMLWMNWQLTLLVLLVIPPFVFIATFYGRRLKNLSTNLQDGLADSTVALEEMLSGMRVVKSFTREPYESTRYNDYLEKVFGIAVQAARQRSIFIPLITFVGLLGVVALLWIGGQQVINATITPGELISFIFYMALVSGPAAEFARLWSQLQEAAGASRRIFEMMRVAPEPGVPTNQGWAARQKRRHQVGLNGTHVDHSLERKESVDGTVRFVDVSFRYEQAEAEFGQEDEESTESGAVREPLPLVLENVNFGAKPGQVIALVGYSGSGKTTLVNLIPRFYDPTAGRIEVDHVDIRSLSVEYLRNQIGLVPQETFLFGGTVRENIAYGRLDATDAEIEAAAEAAYAHEFIDALPNRYETVVGERGVKLSAGQRQRIAIARAILKDPRILILDEATSALDTESERWVQAALDRLMQGRTSFVIAHRLSTIQRADMILVMSGGEIVERGTHESLLANSGLYRRLHEMQFSAHSLSPTDELSSKSIIE